MCDRANDDQTMLPGGESIASIECPVSNSLVPHSAVDRSRFKDDAGRPFEKLVIHCPHCGVDHVTIFESRAGMLAPVKSFDQKRGKSRRACVAA